MSRRNDQIASTLHRTIQGVFSAGFADPRLAGVLLTVTEVKPSQDLRTASVSVSVLPEEREARAIAGIKAAARHIRHEVSDKVAFKKMPELIFKLDSSAKRQAKVLGALAEVRDEWEDESVADTTENKSDANTEPDDQKSTETHS
ncbi:MAG: 30S ribosome-binding factor RbfA [Planctomycetota bacterium]